MICVFGIGGELICRIAKHSYWSYSGPRWLEYCNLLPSVGASQSDSQQAHTGQGTGKWITVSLPPSHHTQLNSHLRREMWSEEAEGGQGQVEYHLCGSVGAWSEERRLVGRRWWRRGWRSGSPWCCWVVSVSTIVLTIICPTPACTTYLARLPDYLQLT